MFVIGLQNVRRRESGRSCNIRFTEQCLLYTDILCVDVDAVAFEEVVFSAVLENGRIILPLVVEHGHHVELDGRIRS